MRLLLVISVSLITVASVVPGNAGDQQTCEERGDPAEAVSACIRLIEYTNLDDGAAQRPSTDAHGLAHRARF